MRAMVFDRKGDPLRLADLAEPTPEPGQVRIRVHACGVCRTDLHVLDGEFGRPVPDGFDDLQAAPLLCAGLIGYRAYRMAGDARRIGIYGFGGAAHILAQVAVSEGREIYAFTRPGDRATQRFARDLGATWA